MFIVAFLAVVIGAMFLLLVFYTRVFTPDRQGVANAPLGEQIRSQNEVPRLPAGLKLQVLPQVDLTNMKLEEDAILNSYGWVNREKGVVRIPVAKAIDIIAKKGLPSRPVSSETTAPVVRANIPSAEGGTMQ